MVDKQLNAFSLGLGVGTVQWFIRVSVNNFLRKYILHNITISGKLNFSIV